MLSPVPIWENHGPWVANVRTPAYGRRVTPIDFVIPAFARSRRNPR